MITINTNTTAMVAQNNLNTTQSNMSSSMLKLSTGLRINSASDDAAGMQISNRMETQINGLGVAQRNANDAISMAQTAEGAMTEVTDMMNRMRDLSLQSANSSNTAEDRGAMQKEMNALASEITRVAEKTEFAGIALLDGDAGAAGSMETFTFQVGANSNETIGFTLKNIDAVSLGVAGNQSTVGSTDLTAATIVTAGTFATAASSKIAVVMDNENIEIELLNKTTSEAKDEISSVLGIDTNDININAAGAVTIESEALSSGKITSFGGSAVTAGTAVSGNTGLDISNKTNADAAVLALDTALKTVDGQRADLGAVQNRLESTIDNLSNISTNMSASQSRIKDVDFAKETTNMTSQQMMMQAGSTILSQAKSLPQYATQLLG